MNHAAPPGCVVDLGPEHHRLYFECLEDWSDEMQEAGDHKERWFHEFCERGLRVKLALDTRGVVGGMIQYLPIEESFAEGRDLYFVPCIWVHRHRQGRGNLQKQGLGRALLAAAEADARALGAQGMAAWGIWLPGWMRASWFRKQGYRKADRDGLRVLLWKAFAPEARPPRWIRERKRPQPLPGRVSVTAFLNGWCSAQNMVFERTRRACLSFGDRVCFETVDTSDRAVLLEWGIVDGVYIDGKPLRTGPPPSYETIRKAIAKRVRRRRHDPVEPQR